MCIGDLFAVVFFVRVSGNWKEELQKYISPDQLPQAYGGTRCEPDPYCTDYVSYSTSLGLYEGISMAQLAREIIAFP